MRRRTVFIKIMQPSSSTTKSLQRDVKSEAGPRIEALELGKSAAEGPNDCLPRTLRPVEL